MTESVLHRARRQGLWLAAGQVVTRGLQFATTVTLARLLVPEHFGIVAIAAVVWEVVALFGNTGVVATLVHRRGDIGPLCEAAFWLNATVAAGIAAASLGVGAGAAAFYDQPAIFPIMGLYAVAFLISSVGTVNSALLARELSFGQVALVDGLGTLASSTGMIGLALAGFGFWSLVLPAPAVAAVRVMLLRRAHRWRPGWRMRRDLWGDIFGYGRYVLGADVVGYLNLNGDYMITGKALGEHALGIYTMAFRVANWPVEAGVWLVSRVAFPALSSLQEDRARLASAFVRMLRFAALLAFPAVAVLWAVAPDLIAALYGQERWGAAAPLIRVILPCVALRALASPASQVLLATGRSRPFFWFGASVTPFLLGAVLYATRFGIAGVAWATALVLGMASAALVALSWRVAGAPAAALPGVLAPGVALAVAGGGGAALGVWLGQAALDAGLMATAPPAAQHGVRMAAALLAGGAATALILRLAFRDDYRRLVSSLGEETLGQRWRRFRSGVAWSLGRRDG